MIDVEGLEKLYGDFPAVRGPAFGSARARCSGWSGPMAPGKTTTLRCIAGIIVPSRGRIRIAGHDLADRPGRGQIGRSPSSPTSRICSTT